MKRDEDFKIGYGHPNKKIEKEIRSLLEKHGIVMKFKKDSEYFCSTTDNYWMIIKYGNRVQARKLCKEYYKNNPDNYWVLIDNFLT
jgi:hypothetical protein